MKKIQVRTSFLLSSFITPSFAEESKSFFINMRCPSSSDIKANGSGYKLNLLTVNPFIYSSAIGKGFEDWRLEFNYSSTTLFRKSLTATVGVNTQPINFTPKYEAKLKVICSMDTKILPMKQNLLLK